MMTYQPLKIGDLEARIPLLQGGMGIGISLGGLAGAVAREGGIGVLSAAQIGFCEPDFGKETVAANLRAMKTEFTRARENAQGGVLGFNIMTAMNHYETYVREAVQLGADLIVSGAGLPMELPRYTEDRRTKLAPIVSTDKSASVLLKYWDRRYHRIPDLLIIEGPKAGGHLGFSREQLENFTEEVYPGEIQKILETVKGYEKKYARKIPCALAGGIDDSGKVKEAFSMGVDAVQCASVFVPTIECDADIRYKEAYIRAEEKDICIVKSPVGMPGRAIYNMFLEKLDAGEKIPHRCYHCLRLCNPAETPYCITEALIHAAKGEIEDALLFCGANAYKAKCLRSVKDVITELMA